MCPITKFGIITHMLPLIAHVLPLTIDCSWLIAHVLASLLIMCCLVHLTYNDILDKFNMHMHWGAPTLLQGSHG